MNVEIACVVIGPVMAHGLALDGYHLVDEVLHSGATLVLSPQIQNSLVTFAVRIFTHAQRCLVRVVGVE